MHSQCVARSILVMPPILYPYMHPDRCKQQTLHDLMHLCLICCMHVLPYAVRHCKMCCAYDMGCALTSLLSIRLSNEPAKKSSSVQVCAGLML